MLKGELLQKVILHQDQGYIPLDSIVSAQIICVIVSTQIEV